MTEPNNNAQNETEDIDLVGALTFALCLLGALVGIVALAMWAFSGY